MSVGIAARFGDNLRRQRKLAGLSQEDVAFRASVHRTEISQLERGLRVARIDTLVKLAGTLDAEPGALLKGITWTPASMQPGRFELPDSDATL